MVFYFDPVYFWYIFIPTLVLSLFVQIFLQSTFRKWSAVKNGAGLNGVQVGRELFARTTLNPIQQHSIAEISVAVKGCIDDLGGITLHRRNEVRVCIEGHFDAGVPEALLYYFGVDTLL